MAIAIIWAGFKLRNRRWTRRVVVLVGVVCFVAADLYCFAIGLERSGEEKRKYRERHFQEQEVFRRQMAGPASSPATHETENSGTAAK